MNKLAWGVVGMVLGAREAHAQTWFEPEEPLKTASITIDPTYLKLPMIHLTGELCAARKLGLAVILGGGEVTDEDSNITFRAYEAGASVRYYAWGTFRQGFQIGVQLLYASVSSENTAFAATNEGIGISPFGGYKWTHRSGFTLESQGGFTYLATGDVRDNRRLVPMVNLNIGWSI